MFEPGGALGVAQEVGQRMPAEETARTARQMGLMMRGFIEQLLDGAE